LNVASKSNAAEPAQNREKAFSGKRREKKKKRRSKRKRRGIK